MPSPPFPDPHPFTPNSFRFVQKCAYSSNLYERGLCALVGTTGREKSMEMSAVVVVVGCVVGRQWQVHWEASGQVSSVNPTTTRPLSTPSSPTSHGDIFKAGPRRPLSQPLLELMFRNRDHTRSFLEFQKGPNSNIVTICSLETFFSFKEY